MCSWRYVQLSVVLTFIVVLSACTPAVAQPTVAPKPAVAVQEDPCEIVVDAVITIDAKDSSWHEAAGFMIDENNSLYIAITGDACFGGGVVCRCPCEQWRPEIKVGDRWREIPFRRFVVTTEWINAIGTPSFKLPDTNYEDNTGQFRIWLTRIPARP